MCAYAYAHACLKIALFLSEAFAPNSDEYGSRQQPKATTAPSKSWAMEEQGHEASKEQELYRKTRRRARKQIIFANDLSPCFLLSILYLAICTLCYSNERYLSFCVLFISLNNIFFRCIQFPIASSLRPSSILLCMYTTFSLFTHLLMGI